MNKELVKEFIDSQPIKVVTKLDLDREKLEYDKIVQCQKRTDTKPEELCRAVLLTKLVNELGYAPERIEIEHEYTAGRPHTITSRIDVIVRDANGDAFLFIEVKNQEEYTCGLSIFSNNPDLRFSAKFHRESGSYVMGQLMEITKKKIKHYTSEPIVLGASISPGDYSDDGELYYISMATIKGWQFNSEGANTVSKSYSDSKIDKTVRKNDIILARSGEGTIGKLALINDESTQGVFADFTMRIRLKDYLPEFAYYYFRTSYFQYLIEIYKKGLGNNTNIFPVVIQEFPMIDIPIDEQQRIVEEIHSEIAKQGDIKAKIAKLRAQIDTIIEDTIAGGERQDG